MKQVNIHYAKTHLSRLLEEASRGEEVVIAKAGKPIAKLVPAEAKRRSGFGSMAAEFPELAKAVDANPDLFIQPLPEEELRLWEGEGSEFDTDS
jgi:prevent-host-death family protein